MSFKKKDKTLLFRTFNIEFPQELIPLYDFLQNELYKILNNPIYYSKLNNLNIIDEEKGKFEARGKSWSKIEAILYDSDFYVEEYFSTETNQRETKVKRKNKINFTEDWNLGSNSWYLRIIIENIRRSLASLYEKRKIYSILQKHGNKISKSLREELTENKLYPTNKELKNLIAYNRIPDLSKDISLELDYSVYDKTMFKKITNEKFEIRIDKDTWINYEIVLPLSLRLETTGKFANPNFVRRKRDNKYVGLCSYQVQKQSLNLSKNILGVDLGFIKLFSAIVLSDKNEISNEFTNSTYLQNNYKKLVRIYESRQRLKDKIKYSGCINFHKNMNRAIELCNLNKKAVNIKKSLMEELAAETIELAIQQNCSIIKVEDLGVMSNITGKWNYGVYHKKLADLGEIYGITIYKINPQNTSKKHPITKEIGEIGKRIVKFKDEKIDRDLLASINLAIRSTNIKIKQPLPKTVKTVRVITKSRRKEIKDLVNKIKGKEQIVSFLTNVSDVMEFSMSLEVRPLIEVSPLNSLLVKNYKKLQF